MSTIESTGFFSMPRLRSITAAVAIAVLAGCGGGSDGPAPAAGAGAGSTGTAGTTGTSSGTPASGGPVAGTPGTGAPSNGDKTESTQGSAARNFTIAPVQDKAIVFQGGSLAVRLKLTRQTGFAGPVAVALTGLPEGVSATSAFIAAEATEVDLTLAALGTAPHSLPTTVTVEGTAIIDGVADRASNPLTVTVRGVAGMVDTSFAGGSFLTRVGASEDYPFAAAVQADGKVLVAGSSASNLGNRIAVVRYLRDGTIDTTFGDAGRAIVAVGTRDDVARAIAVQPDGRIVVAGLSYQRTADYDFTLVRLMPNGALDTGFGDQGKVLTDFGGDSDRAFALALMPDGRIVAGGQTNLRRGSTGVDFALARYLADGKPDSSFGSGGKVIEAILPGSTSDMVRGLAWQTVNGSLRLLAVGGEGDFTAARFTESGALDASFGAAGKVSGLFGVSIGAAHAVTVLPTGEAVIAGHVGHDFAAVRLTVNGQLDPAFGPVRDGRLRHPMVASNWDEATAIAHQADGRLLLGGWVYAGVGTAGDFGVLRLTADGTLDPSFGQNGTMIQAVAGTKTDLAHALVLQADERVPTVRAIVAGEAQDVNRDFALMRLWL